MPYAVLGDQRPPARAPRPRSRLWRRRRDRTGFTGKIFRRIFLAVVTTCPFLSAPFRREPEAVWKQQTGQGFPGVFGCSFRLLRILANRSLLTATPIQFRPHLPLLGKGKRHERNPKPAPRLGPMPFKNPSNDLSGLKPWPWASFERLGKISQLTGYLRCVQMAGLSPPFSHVIMIVLGNLVAGLPFWVQHWPAYPKSKDNPLRTLTFVIGTEKAGRSRPFWKGTAKEMKDRSPWEQFAQIYNAKYGGRRLPDPRIIVGGNVYRVVPRQSLRSGRSTAEKLHGLGHPLALSKSVRIPLKDSPKASAPRSTWWAAPLDALSAHPKPNPRTRE